MPHLPIILWKRRALDNRCDVWCVGQCDGLENAFYTRDEAIAFIDAYLLTHRYGRNWS